MAIVELDQQPRERRPRRRDGGIIAALLAAASLFAFAVWITRPVTTPAAQRVADAQSVPAAQSMTTTVYSRDGSTTVYSRDGTVILIPPRLPLPANSAVLDFPRAVRDVDLAVIPDRLANEAPPSILSNVVWVRGRAGIATVPFTDGPAVIWWTEGGMAYWLVSATYTIDELVQLADELRMQPSPDEWRR